MVRKKTGTIVLAMCSRLQFLIAIAIKKGSSLNFFDYIAEIFQLSVATTRVMTVNLPV